jgi:hypothetical protein
MLHDQGLLDRLAAFAPVKFDGDVFRATRRGLDPLAASVAGGRWMVPNQTPTLYTGCERDGALAEIVHHWGQLTPLPSKPVIVHTLGVRLGKSLRLGRAELIDLDVDWDRFGGRPIPQTRETRLGDDKLAVPRSCVDRRTNQWTPYAVLIAGIYPGAHKCKPEDACQAARCGIAISRSGPLCGAGPVDAIGECRREAEHAVIVGID